MSDYLWDKTGEPDAEVEHLATLLSSMRHTPRPLTLPLEGAAGESPRPRRRVEWRRFFPARLFEPVGLAVASALVLSLLFGASVLMRARVAMYEDRAASGDVRRQPPQAPSGQAPTRGRPESPSTPRPESSSTSRETAERGPGPANVQAKGSGGVPSAQDASRKRAGAQSVFFVKPRQKPAAAAPSEQTVARAGGTGTLEALSTKGREGATTLFDGTRMMAKEQLIYALRLTGAKLKEVESKAHGADDSKPAARGGVR
jgi:hypothetical protein